MGDVPSFGAWLKRRRKALDLTQERLAQLVGCSVVTIRKIEAEVQPPSRQLAELLAEHLTIPPEERATFVQFARMGLDAAPPELPLPPAARIPDRPSASPAPRSVSRERTHQDKAPQATPAHLLPSFQTAQLPSSVAEQTIFVARRHQLAQLHDFLHRALAGPGQVVFVTGDAGSGKTALLREFTRQVHQTIPDLVAALGVCNAYTGVGDPYLPFREIMAMLTGDLEPLWQAGAISRQQAVRLWDLFPQAADALLNHGPNLLDTFVPGQSLAARAAAYPAMDRDWVGWLQAQLAQDNRPRPDQSRLFEEYVAVLRTLAATHPLLLLLDDLHWADASSVSLLFYLGRRLAGCRILIVGSYRPEEVAMGWRGEPHPLAEVIGEFKRQYGDTHVSLDEANAEGRHFVDALLDLERNRLDESFRQALFRQSGGHALFTIELLRDLQERGFLIQDASNYWVAKTTLDWQTLPARVEGVIARRIGRLDPKLRETLAVASVEGEDFTAEVAARVQMLDERQLVQVLGSELDRRHRLVRAQEIRSVGARRLSLYRFRHHLFQKYLYDSLDTAERAYLHEAVGEALEELYREQQEQLALIAAQLARHFQAARRVEKAIDYHFLAGQQAVKVSANQEAIAHFQTGLALLQSLPNTPERVRRELTLQIALGVPMTASKGYAHPDVEPVYTRARVLSAQLGATAQLFPALYGLWRMTVIQGKLQVAQALSEQLMDMAQSAQDPDLLVEAYRAAGGSAFHVGELVTARSLYEQGLALYNPEQHRHHAYLYGHDPAISCLGYLAHTLWLLGYPDQALARGRELLRLAQELSHPFSLGHALVWGASVLHQLRREAPEVQATAQAGIDLAAERGFPYWQSMGTILLGWAIAQQGENESGIAHTRQGIVDWQAAGAESQVPYFLALLAETHGHAGQAEAGLAVIADALAVIEQTGERWYEAELHRLNGELRWQAGASEAEAETLFQWARSVAQQQQAKSLELRATMSLGRLWHNQGRGSAAHALLTEVYDWFSEGLDTPDLQAAAVLLAAWT